MVPNMSLPYTNGAIDRQNADQYIKRNYPDDTLSRVGCKWQAEIVEPVRSTGEKHRFGLH